MQPAADSYCYSIGRIEFVSHTHSDQEKSESHRHGHGHRPGSRELKLVLAITSAYMIAEVIGGILTNSLALLADAGHMLSDVASLALSLLAMRFATRPRTASMTYGYFRAEILAALTNGVTLVVVSFAIMYEAIQRLQAPPVVQSGPMLVVASIGLVVNIVGAWILSRRKGESLNVRGAYLHVLADALGSVGAIVAGVLMLTGGLYYVDPLFSMFIALLILFSSWRLLKESATVLMEGTPSHLNGREIEEAIKSIPGVADVHDLHVWTVTSGFVSLSAHLRVTHCDTMVDAQHILALVRTMIKDRFDIEHTTIQLEQPEEGQKAELRL
jgi:cobalt-zinc-cadmium efflux system protein